MGWGFGAWGFEVLGFGSFEVLGCRAFGGSGVWGFRVVEKGFRKPPRDGFWVVWGNRHILYIEFRARSSK